MDLGEVDIDPSAVELLGEDLMRRYAVMPLRVEYGRLKIAMSDPSSTFARADLGLETGFPLDVVVASAEDIRQAQERLFTSHAGTPGPTEHSTVGETPEAVAPDMGVVEAEGPALILRQGMRTLEMKVDPGVAGLVDEGLLHEHTAIPVRLEEGTLLVAVSDLSHASVLEALMSASDYRLSFVEAARREIRQVQNDLLPPAGTPGDAGSRTPAREPRETPGEEEAPETPPREDGPEEQIEVRGGGLLGRLFKGRRKPEPVDEPVDEGDPGKLLYERGFETGRPAGQRKRRPGKRGRGFFFLIILSSFALIFGLFEPSAGEARGQRAK